MISVYRSTPRKYYRDSRDFQFIGRVFEALFNYLKMNVDLASANPLSANSDVHLLPLLAKTLGFESKHEYNTEELRALCSCFSSIIRKKGSFDGISEAINAFLSAKGLEAIDVVASRNPEDYMDLSIYLPIEVGDTSLLEDVFDYTMPAGMTYNFVRAIGSREDSTTEIRTSDKVWNKPYSADEIGQVSKADSTNKVNTTRPDQIADGRDSLTALSTSSLGAVVGANNSSDAADGQGE